MLVRQRNNKKIGTAVNATCQGTLSTYHRFTNHTIGHSWYFLYIRKYNIQRRILFSQHPWDWVGAGFSNILVYQTVTILT